jgi:SAM-dependent methyltransferase
MPGAPSTPYDPIAALYDLEHASFADDISLMRNIADIVGDPIVELGCGSGRVLLPIAADGFDVTGVDTSRPMLDELERRAADIDGGTVTTVQGDMRGPLPLPPDTFGVAIFSLNGLLHLETQADQIAALAEAARILDPRGQLLIDIFHPTPEYLTQLAPGPHLEGVWTDAAGREVEKWSHRRVNPASQTIDTRLWYDTIRDDGTVERVRTAFTLRYIHAAELELMLHRAGFVEWKLYGTYELDPLDDASDRIVALAELTPSE